VALGTLGVASFVLAALWILSDRLPPVARPAVSHEFPSYAAAMALIDSLRAHDDAQINPMCHPRVLTGGARSDRVLVVFHGFTNCPKQFDLLAEAFSRIGYNVFMPRLPGHGMADRMSEDLRTLTAEDLVQAGESAVEIAHGLGDHVTIMGLSSGAVLAAWLARNRTDIDCVVLIAPSFAPHGVPEPAARRLTSILRGLPNFFLWWDPRSRENVLGPKQAYPRYASHALAEVYRLGFEVIERPDLGRLAAKVVLITSAADEAVNNDLAFELVRRWRSRGADVRTFEFPAVQGVRHDMIDPEQPYERTRVTYPVIEHLTVEGERRGFHR
jgi:alpha-beta hydrolase superfamily lysophospholipase